MSTANTISTVGKPGSPMRGRENDPRIIIEQINYDIAKAMNKLPPVMIVSPDDKQALDHELHHLNHQLGGFQRIIKRALGETDDDDVPF